MVTIISFSTHIVICTFNLRIHPHTHTGVPPTDCLGFFEHISSKDAPDLSHTHYTVLALGDYNYPHFCKTGKQLETRYEQQQLYPVTISRVP